MSTVIQPEGWVAPKGYANGILASGRLVFTGGQIGWNPKVTPPEFSVSFAEQFEQALSNVCDVVKAAGGSPEHLTRRCTSPTRKNTSRRSKRAARPGGACSAATTPRWPWCKWSRWSKTGRWSRLKARPCCRSANSIA